MGLDWPGQAYLARSSGGLIRDVGKDDMETVYIETSVVSHATASPSSDPALFVL